MAQLARRVGTAGPDVKIVARPVFKSVTTTCSGTSASSSRWYGMWASRIARRLSLAMKWLVRPSKPAALWIGFRGKTSCRRSPSQISLSSSMPSALGRPATQAALTAPTEVPTRRSGAMRLSKRAFSIPTWTAPRLPPPEKTNAVRRDPSGRGAARPTRLIASGRWAPQSRRLVGVVVFASLPPQGLEHVRGIEAIPQPPVGLRLPHLVEHGLELAVQVGRVELGFEPHHPSPTSKTRTEPAGYYHYWTVLEFHG